jgi:hypothetical protein
MDAVAEQGSKYFINGVGELKSCCSATALPFLEDLPAELAEGLRWRGIVGWLEDDIATVLP